MLTGAERTRLATLFDGRLAPFVDSATVEILPECQTARPASDLLVVLDGRGRHWPNGPRRDVGPSDLVFDPNVMELATQLLAQLHARTPMRLARLKVPRPCPVPIAELIADLMEAEQDTWVRRGQDVTVSARSFLRDDAEIEPPPYTFRDAVLQLFVLDPDTERREADGLPPIATAPPDELTDLGARPLLVMARYPHVVSGTGRELAYEEGCLFTPALLGLKPGVDTVWIRPESMMAELMGRERFGLQKRQARLDFRDRMTRFQDATNDLELSWDRAEAAETLPVLHELADHLTPIPLASGLLPALATNWLTERLQAPTMIFSRVPTGRPDEHRLIASPFSSKAPRKARRLLGSRLWCSASSELREARVLYGCELELEFELGTAGPA